MKKEKPSGVTPKRRKGQKTIEAGTLSDRRMSIAAVCGKLAALPDLCETLKLAATRLQAICLEVSESGIVDNTKSDLLEAVAAQAGEMLSSIASCREIADLMRRGAVAPESEIFAAGEVSLV